MPVSVLGEQGLLPTYCLLYRVPTPKGRKESIIAVYAGPNCCLAVSGLRHIGVSCIYLDPLKWRHRYLHIVVGKSRYIAQI